jgi:hypothetical protein
VVAVWLATAIVLSVAVVVASAGATLIATRNRLGNALGRRYASLQGHDLDGPTEARSTVIAQRALGAIGLVAVLMGITILSIGLAALHGK